MPISADSPYVRITGMRKALVTHPLYAELDSLASVRIFAKHHVFAVWDFMSLLKALQRTTTCVQVPWVPVGNAKIRRFINEIVVEEESDADGRRGYASHFELYCAAMKDCGADLRPVEAFMAELQTSAHWSRALDAAKVPDFVRQFVRNTMDVALSGKPHCVAAAFFYGREDIIPDMFRAFVNRLHEESSSELERFVYYIDRHIEVDGESHGPLARHMTTMLCQRNRTYHKEAADVALQSLRSRMQLWDGVLEEIQSAKRRSRRRRATAPVARKARRRVHG